MKIRIRNELLLLNLLAFLLIIVIVFLPSNVLRIILGLPFVLFFPGYALMAVLFPKRARMSGIERAALSLGLSIAVVPLIGLVLSFTPWGIKLESILFSIASFIFILSVVAWLRRKRLPEEERFDIEFYLRMPNWRAGIRDKVLSIILVITILGGLSALGYTIARPKVGERFSEFYVVGLGGKAEGYPKELLLGKEGRVIVGIVNHEYEVVSYRLEVEIDGVKNNEVGPLELGHDEKWEEIVSFTPHKAGESQKVEFLLYKNGETKPCLEPLRLWLDVKE